MINRLSCSPSRISHRNRKGIRPVVRSTGGEMGSQRRDGVDGRQTARHLTDHERETVTETDAESETRSPPSRLRDSSTMSVAGKTGSSEKKTKSTISEAQTTLLLTKRNRTLGCQGRWRKTPTHTGGWWSNTTNHLRLAFPSEGGDSTLSRTMKPFQSCTFTDRVPICSADRGELLISPSTTHPVPNNTQFSSTGKIVIYCVSGISIFGLIS